MNLINVVQLGRVSYADGLRIQADVIAARKTGTIGDTLLLLEHNPVITLGRNAKEQNILVSREHLAQRGVEVFDINRGGDVTFHGPGQLVAYPIFNILQMQPKLGAIDFVRRLEEVLIRTSADYGIPTQRIKGMTGVWTNWPASTNAAESDSGAEQQARKIAALGIHISRGVTSHGIALNVTTDLSYFQLIVPCGLVAKPVTSIAAETGRSPSLDEVSQSIARHFGSVFTAQVLWLDSLDKLMPSNASAVSS